ncbi:MAG: 50S ribosomal protein L6 [Acholeplasmataceae bacterium]
MSRIGNKPINIPAGVTVTINDNNHVIVKGPKGQLEENFHEVVSITQEGNELIIKRPNNEIFSRKIHGTTRAILFNMVEGVTNGFKKDLEIHGVGYRANLQGKTLVLQLGFSHNIEIEIPDEVDVEVPRNTQIKVSGINKQVVGEFAAKIRSFRKPEPYKGKGIRYADEYVPRKAGKTAS